MLNPQRNILRGGVRVIAGLCFANWYGSAAGIRYLIHVASKRLRRVDAQGSRAGVRLHKWDETALSETE